MKTHFFSILGLLIVLLLTCGCQKNPNGNLVVSKNDGSFDISIIQSASDAETTHENKVSSENSEVDNSFRYNNIFVSTDKTVEFNIALDTDIQNAAMPVVEVTPHNLTEEEAKHIAQVLFGDAIYYEAEPLGEEIYSVAEIQDKINRLLSYQGNVGVANSSFDATRKRFIENYTLRMEVAPVENQHKLCQWNYRKASYYYWPSEEFEKMDTSQDNDEIQVRVKINGVPYLYTVSTRNKKDFKLNNIYVSINDGMSTLFADPYIFQNRLCSTSRPTPTDIDALINKAENLLEQMDLGQWKVDEYYVEEATHNKDPEYTVVINAVPEFSGVAALRRDQLTNLKSSTSYASNYYLTDVQFRFNISGELIGFKMSSPIDVKSTINDNVKTLGMDELVRRAEEHLSLSDYYQYDYMGYLNGNNEEMICQIDIPTMEYGLTRVKAPNTDESYYYVPSVIFRGKIQYQEKETGNVYGVDTYTGKDHILLILNAIDGSVINATNE